MKYPILAIALSAALSTEARQPRNLNSDQVISKSKSRLDSPARKLSGFQFGLNIGAMCNATFQGYRAPEIHWLSSNSPSALIAIKGFYTTRNWRYGIALARGGISYRTSRTEMFGGPLTFIDKGRLPAYQSRLTIDRVLTKGKAEVYCGAATGVLFWNESPEEKLWFSRGRGIVTSYTAGLQAGLNYRIDQGTHLNAHLACDYVNADFDFLTYSLTVGLRISLYSRAHP